MLSVQADIGLCCFSVYWPTDKKAVVPKPLPGMLFQGIEASVVRTQFLADFASICVRTLLH